MKILLEQRREYFAIGHDHDYIYVLSNCCGTVMRCMGNNTTICIGCSKIIKQISMWATHITIRYSVMDSGVPAVSQWFHYWTGLEDVQVHLDSGLDGA